MPALTIRESARVTTAAGVLGSVLGLALATAGCALADGPPGAASDSAGVTLVRSSDPDRPLAWTAEMTRRLEVPDSTLTAVPWGVAADPAAGRIYALDWTGERVAVFDRAGAFVEWIGQRGEGPGEFRNPSALALDPHGALHVLDGGRGIVSRWSPTGELLDEVRAPASYWGPGLAADGAGWTYVVSSEMDVEQRETLVRDTGGETEELYSLARELVMMDLPCVGRPAARVFAPSVVWATRGDTVYVREGDGYRIDVLVDGGLVASYRRPLEPIPVTGAMAEARVRMGPYSGVMRACGVTAADVVTAVGHEEATSPVFWLAPDPAGRIWVTRSEDGVRPSRVDVLGADGEYLGTLDLPGIPVAFLSDSVFVGVAPGPLGVTLTRYELRAGPARAGASNP